MSRSLLLPRRLSPSVVLGVSLVKAETLAETVGGRESVLSQFGRRLFTTTNEFPRHLGVLFGIPAATGARARGEELPIRPD